MIYSTNKQSGETVDRFRNKAKGFALARWRNRQEAEDFASFAVEKNIIREGAVNLKSLYIDFIRSKVFSKKEIPLRNRSDFPIAQSLHTVEDFERFLSLEQVVNSLKEKDRLLLIIKYVYGFKNAEIAWIYGISEDSVASRVYEMCNRLSNSEAIKEALL